MDIRVNYLLEVKLRIREGGNIVVHLVFTRISTRRALLVLLAMATDTRNRLLTYPNSSKKKYCRIKEKEQTTRSQSAKTWKLNGQSIPGGLHLIALFPW